MDFKIDEQRTKIGAFAEPNVKKINSTDAEEESDFVTFTSSEERQASEQELKAYNKPVAATGDRLDLGAVKNALDFLKASSEATEKEAEERYQLAKTAKNQPERSAQARNLQTESDSISTEITRISSAVSSRGIPGVLTYDVNKTQDRNAVAAVPLSASISAPSATLTTRTTATTAITNLDYAQGSIRVRTADISIARDKAENFAEPNLKTEKIPAAPAPEDTSQAVEKAKQLSNSVASQLSNAAGDDEQISRLIDVSTKGLSADRVRELLA
ncbi:MAG: hypothetical protein K1X79_05595 [Oligoflexia bacterium]|nr:hypothetical protein [Oligoflexia bacterium]